MAAMACGSGRFFVRQKLFLAVRYLPPLCSDDELFVLKWPLSGNAVCRRRVGKRMLMLSKIMIIGNLGKE